MTCYQVPGVLSFCRHNHNQDLDQIAQLENLIAPPPLPHPDLVEVYPDQEKTRLSFGLELQAKADIIIYIYTLG